MELLVPQAQFVARQLFDKIFFTNSNVCLFFICLTFGSHAEVKS